MKRGLKIDAGPGTRAEEIEPASVWRIDQLLVEREAGAGPAEGRVKAVGRTLAATHAEEHGDGFGDGEIVDPMIGFTPGSERGNGERDGGQCGMDALKDVSIKGTLRKGSIEIDLDGADAWDLAGGGNRGSDGCGSGERSAIGIDANDGHQGRAGRVAQRIQTWTHGHGAVP